MNALAQVQNAMVKHGRDCADFAFETAAEKEFDPVAVDIIKAAAHQQIADDIQAYGAGKTKPKILRVLTTQCRREFDRHFDRLMREREGGSSVQLVTAND